MRAYAVDTFGEAGSVRDLAGPTPGEGEVLVRVAAAGVNPVDAAVVAGYLKDMMEHRFPLVPGIDASGVVEAVGGGVTGWAVGDEVFGTNGKMSFGEGTYAEYAAVSAGTIARRPASLDPVVAGATPLAAATALTLLDAVEAGPGQTLLAIGAAGGVGTFLIQLATDRGATVIAVARAENEPYVRDLGAADAIDYTAGDLAESLRARYPDGIDAIADMVGDKETVTRLGEQVRPGGRVASASGGADQEALAGRDVKADNIQAMTTTDRLDGVAAAFADGRLRLPHIEGVPLDRAGEALARVGARHVRGKLAIVVS